MSEADFIEYEGGKLWARRKFVCSLPDGKNMKVGNVWQCKCGKYYEWRALEYGIYPRWLSITERKAKKLINLPIHP